MGCSHFIIGRDHTGLANFYNSKDNNSLFKELGDIGIIPIFFNQVAFNLDSLCHEEIKDNCQYGQISGSTLREYFLTQKKIPEWFIENDIRDMINDRIEKGIAVFHE